MEKHLILTCVAYSLFGAGCMLTAIGVKAGYSLWEIIIPFGVILGFYLFVVLTSLEKIKEKLYKEEDA